MNLQRGLTLLEMVVTLVVIALLAAGAAFFLARPLQTYLILEQRHNLVYEADLAMTRLREELRLALPNSVRIDCKNQCIIEFMTVVAVYYVRTSDKASPEYTLAKNAPDDTFHLLTDHLTTREGNDFIDNNPLPAQYHLSFKPDNSDSFYKNLAENKEPSHITAQLINITPTRIQGPDNVPEVRITLDPPFKFASSNEDSIYLVEGPVLYLCDVPNHTLFIYRNYTPNSNLSIPPTADGAILSNRLTNCNFQHKNQNQKDLYALELTFQDSNAINSNIHLYETVLVEPEP